MKLSVSTRTAAVRRRPKYQPKEVATCFAMLALPLIGLLVFTIYPIVWAAVISLFSYTGVPSQTRFIGLENYITMLTQNTGYWKSWLVNLEFMVFKTPVEMLLALITANLLMKNTRLAGLYRSIYFMPAVVSVATVGLIFSNLFDYFGFINAVLKSLHLIDNNIDWFASKPTAMIALFAGSFWQAFGTTVLYFMAAISTVPKEVYESAKIDGANGATVLFRLTLPMIAPVLQVILLLSISGLLQINEYILVMTNGAPAGSTYTVSAYLTSKIVTGYGQVANIGYASAMSIVTSVIFCVIGVVFNKFTNRLQNVY